MRFDHTTCCAMGIISANNETPLNLLRGELERRKEESLEYDWFGTPNIGGEKAFLCITTPHEKKLEENLKILGFKVIADKLNRRTGYPDGTLKLWIINW